MSRKGYLYAWVAIDRAAGTERMTPLITEDRDTALGEHATQARALVKTGVTLGQPISVELRRYEQVSMVMRIDRPHGHRVEPGPLVRLSEKVRASGSEGPGGGPERERGK